MTSSSFTKSQVEEAALAWLEGLGSLPRPSLRRLRVPERHFAGRMRVVRELSGLRAIDLRDERRGVLLAKRDDSRGGSNDVLRQFCVRCLPNDDEKRDVVSYDGGELVEL